MTDLLFKRPLPVGRPVDLTFGQPLGPVQDAAGRLEIVLQPFTAGFEGRLAYDNAVSSASAINKGIVSEVAGRPDILLLPDLEAGNMIYKQLVYMAGAECAGLVLGMKVPIILTSRSDSITARITSCALAVLVATRASGVGARA